jgi:uncharacterized membrane protein
MFTQFTAHRDTHDESPRSSTRCSRALGWAACWALLFGVIAISLTLDHARDIAWLHQHFSIGLRAFWPGMLLVVIGCIALFFALRPRRRAMRQEWSGNYMQFRKSGSNYWDTARFGFPRMRTVESSPWPGTPSSRGLRYPYEGGPLVGPTPLVDKSNR